MGLAALLLLPYWLVQGLRHGKYLSNLGQRLGFSFPSLRNAAVDRPGAIWIHAVSVGEVLSSVALARRLKETYPARPLVVSTTTITGQALAQERMPFADAVFYFPLDWAFSVRRALRAVKPAIVIILETEMWPNFLREARRREIPVFFVSGRISDRSFARYQSYLGAFGFFLRPFLRRALSCATAFLMQSENDAARIRALGASADCVRVSGNLKYDLELPAPTPLANWLGNRSPAGRAHPPYRCGQHRRQRRTARPHRVWHPARRTSPRSPRPRSAEARTLRSGCRIHPRISSPIYPPLATACSRPLEGSLTERRRHHPRGRDGSSPRQHRRTRIALPSRRWRFGRRLARSFRGP